MKMNKQIALWCLVGCALLWSTSGFLIKSINFSPLAISGGRSLIAALFLMLVRGWPKLSKHPIFWGATFAYAATLTTYVAATRLTTAADAILLQYTAPVYVLLFGYIFLKERITRIDILATCLVMGGLVIFFLDSIGGGRSTTAMIGNALAVFSGISFGLQAVLLRKVKLIGLSAESVLISGNLLCFLIAIPALIPTRPSGMDMIWLTILGVVQLGVSYLLYSAALRYVTSLELILIPIIEPVLNPIIVFFLRGEKPGAATIFGGAFILIVVVLWCLYRANPPNRQSTL
jgi:drug/metabolite transporter (DMT)-like permease